MMKTEAVYKTASVFGLNGFLGGLCDNNDY
jgi:hypothetical protein